MKIKVFLMGVIFLFLGAASVKAEYIPTTMDLVKEIKQLKAVVEGQNERIAVLEMRLSKEEECNIRQSEAIEIRENTLQNLRGIEKVYQGLEIGVASTIVGQGTSNANGVGNGQHKSRFDGSYSADLTFEKRFDDYGMAFAHLEAGQGAGLTDKLNVYSNVNYDATAGDNTAEFLEAWYQQNLFNKQVILTGGKIDGTYFIDTNNYANDETTQFLSSIFRNSPTVEFPGNAFGGRIFLTSDFLMKSIELEAVYMDAEGEDWDDIFNKGFIGTQLNYMPARTFGYSEEKWEGNYRLYLWSNGQDHIEISKPDSSKEINYGFGLSCDQKLGENLGCFGRFGWSNPNVYRCGTECSIGYTWSTGLEASGRWWNRDNDKAALAIGQVLPSGKYKEKIESGFRGNETHMEGYYSFYVNEHLTLSPDLQIIWDPHGQTKNQNAIFVYGLRAQIDL